MNNVFKDGTIVNKGQIFEKTQYNVSNETISACFDSTGAVSYYAEADKEQLIHNCRCHYYINGEYIDVFCDRTVEMLGRKQSVSIQTPVGTIRLEQFLDKTLSGVFFRFWVEGKKADAKIEVVYYVGEFNKIKLLSDRKVEGIPDNSSFFFDISSNDDGIKLFLTSRGFDEEGFCIAKAFYKAETENADELADISMPDGLSETEKAMYLNCYYCALENYKEKGDYKAFMAGQRYLLPMRSYYRDSYYTVLPMYNGHTDKVRNQIIALTKGISEDGTCPSAVKSDYTAWWGNHYDSPSFLALMLYDYVKHTGDTDFLRKKIDGVTVYDKAEAAVVKLSMFADETNLLYKGGIYNKRDWADEVNRYGYVTYDEVLYARAWLSLSRLCMLLGEQNKGNMFEEKYHKVKDAINTLLWDEKLGYYVNFKNHDYTENNLSIDTVFAVIFGIADATRAQRVLHNMENMLECRNNTAVKAADFGVMSVYPFYKHPRSAYNKSSEPFHYHNGSNWPYLSAMYAYAKRQHGMEYKYALESWFTYNVEKHNFTPIEYFSSVQPDGSLLQAWSSAAAFVLDEKLSKNFWD